MESDREAVRKAVVREAAPPTISTGGLWRGGPSLDEFDPRRIGGRLEHIDAAAGTIQRKDPAFRADRDGVNAVELARLLAQTPELSDVIHAAVEDHHAVIGQSVRDQNPAVRKKRDVLRL